MSNSNVDIIRGNPKRAINKLAYPMMLSMLLIMSNNIIDSIWVSGLGSEALAALGFVTPLFIALVGIGNGLGAGGNAVISKYIGSKSDSEANNAAIHTIILSILISIILTIVLVAFLKPMLILMGAKEVLTYSMEYGFIIFLFTSFILIPPIFGGILRAEGDIKRSTIPIAITAIINIILDPIFIYIFNWGMKGAAFATSLASFIPLLLMIYWMFIKKDTYLSFNKKYFKSKLSMYKDILLVGLPASLEEIIMTMVAIILNYFIVIIGGTTAVASYTATWRLISIGIIPAMGIGTATITVTGVAYGARNIKNLEISTKYALKLGLIISAIITILFFVFANQISVLFTYASGNVRLSTQIADCLRIMAFFILPIPFGMTAAYTYQGLGKGPTSLFLTILRELILALIFAYLLGFTLNFGLQGLYWGIIIGDIIGSIIGYLMISHHINKLKKIW